MLTIVFSKLRFFFLAGFEFELGKTRTRCGEGNKIKRKIFVENAVGLPVEMNI